MNSPFSQQISRKGMKPEKDLSKEFPENLKKYYAFNQVTIVELYFSFIRLTSVEKFSSLPFSTFETSGFMSEHFRFPCCRPYVPLDSQRLSFRPRAKRLISENFP